MKKWPWILAVIVLIALIFALAVVYPAYLTILSTTGETIANPVRRKQATGIAVTASLIVIGIIGYLTSRNK